MTATKTKPNSLAHFGSLLGDPVRASMLLHLSDGSSRPAGELAHLAGASPQSASAHLTQLLDSGLLAVEQQGRHRFFRLASGEAAEIIEQLSSWIDEPHRRTNVAPHLRKARLCYDHLAGELGVNIFESLSNKGLFAVQQGALELSDQGRSWCQHNDIDLGRSTGSRRPIVRLCLDWTERRHHVGGHFGAALTDWLMHKQFISRGERQRALIVTETGRIFLRDQFGIVAA